MGRPPRARSLLDGHRAWIRVDRFGERISYVPPSPADPVFHLRRVGGGASHVRRLFRTRDEAAACLGGQYRRESEACEWAEALAAGDFAEPPPPSSRMSRPP